MIWLMNLSADCLDVLDATAVTTWRRSCVPRVLGSMRRSLTKSLAISPVAAVVSMRIEVQVGILPIIPHLMVVTFAMMDAA